MFESMVPVLIVAIVFSFISFSVYMKYQTDRLRLGIGEGSAKIQQENEQLKTQVAALEKRIQVLESIVTRKDFQLESDINALA